MEGNESQQSAEQVELIHKEDSTPELKATTTTSELPNYEMIANSGTLEKMSDEEYFAIAYASNSTLSYIDPYNDGSPRKYQAAVTGQWEKRDTAGMRLGSYVHMYLLEPEKFCVIDVSRPDPTTKIGKFTDAYIEYMLSDSFKMQRGSKNPIILDAEAFRYARNVAEYSDKFKDDTVRKSFDESGKPYYEALKTHKGKIFLTDKEKATIEALKQSIEKKTIVAEYLSEAYAATRGWETHNEIVLTTVFSVRSMVTDEYVDIPFKGKLDRLIVDHENKTVYLVDVKTTSGGVYNFNKTIRVYNYDRQMFLYNLLLKQRYPEYNIITKFIVLQSTGINDVAVGTVDRSWLINGGLSAQALLSRLAFHIQQDTWDISIEEVLNGGELQFEKPQYNTSC